MGLAVQFMQDSNMALDEAPGQENQLMEES